MVKEKLLVTSNFTFFPSVFSRLVLQTRKNLAVIILFQRPLAGGGLTRNVERDAGVETDSDKEMIPNESDFVIGYATVPGYVSFRSRTHGSWYIRKLCELLEKHSHKYVLLYNIHCSHMIFGNYCLDSS